MFAFCMREVKKLSLCKKRTKLAVFRKEVRQKLQRMSTEVGPTGRVQGAEVPQEEVLDWCDSPSNDASTFPVSMQLDNDQVSTILLKEIEFAQVGYSKRSISKSKSDSNDGGLER